MLSDQRTIKLGEIRIASSSTRQDHDDIHYLWKMHKALSILLSNETITVSEKELSDAHESIVQNMVDTGLGHWFNDWEPSLDSTLPEDLKLASDGYNPPDGKGLLNLTAEEEGERLFYEEFDALQCWTAPTKRKDVPKNHFFDPTNKKYPYKNSDGTINCGGVLAAKQAAAGARSGKKASASVRSKINRVWKNSCDGKKKDKEKDKKKLIRHELARTIFFKDMTKEDWIKAWKGKPHFGNSLVPSKLAKTIIREDKENTSKSNILEIGCGNGRDSLYFGKQGYSVIGIDISPDAIRIAEKNNKLNNVVFEVGDAEELDFDDEYFDVVYSLSVLHSTNLEKSIKEVSRVLVSNGLALFYLYNKTTYTDKDGNNKIEVNFNIGDFEKTLGKNNLRILDKFRNMSDNEPNDDDDGYHVHSIYVYLLQKGQ